MQPDRYDLLDQFDDPDDDSDPDLWSQEITQEEV